jgi:glycosyltransferase involved in cell wall biosynthesis
MKRPSILHIGKFYPPHPGGMETHLRSLVGYQSRDFDVEVLVGNDQPRTVRESLDGARITRLATYGSVASMPIVPGFLPSLVRRREDLVHLHMPNPAAAAAFLASGHRGKLVITHHGDTLGRKRLRKLTEPFSRAAMERASAIIVSSQRYVDSSEELRPYRDKCHIIPLGMDIAPPTAEVLAKAQTLRAQYQARRLLVAAGRLVPYKGFEYLLRALSGVDATLLLIGRGSLRDHLQRVAVEVGVADRVHFLGFVESVEPYLHAADIFVMPSITRAESFGLVQLEAMAAGVPVINTDLASAVPEISLNGVTGVTVPPADAAALAEAIRLLLQDRKLRSRYGVAAKERVPLFSAAEMAEQHAELYANVLT